MNNILSCESIKKAIKVLRKYKVKEPYWVEVENLIEKGDPLEGVDISKIDYNSASAGKYGGVRFIKNKKGVSINHDRRENQ